MKPARLTVLLATPQAGHVDLFAQVVHGHIGRGAHEHLALSLLNQVVHQRRGRHRLACTGRALVTN